jgi:phage portal protein BeeE
MISAYAESLTKQSNGWRAMAQKAISSRANPLYAGSRYSAAASGGFAEMEQHTEQYRQFRGHVYTAIRPICVRLAKQDIRVGVQVTSGPRTQKALGEMTMKAFGRVCGFRTGSRRDDILDRAPAGIRTKMLTDGLEALDSHPLIESMENPNELLTKWQQMFLTIAGLYLTGKGFWWAEDDTGGLMRFWPIPASWVRPRWSGSNLRDGWYVQPTMGGTPIPVDGRDMLYFNFPDPSDPLTGAISPVQSQGDAVSIDRYLQRSRLASFRQGPKPGIILTAGRMKDQDGRDLGARPVLTPEQRTDLIDAVRYIAGGVEKHGDPFIVDGLIESVTPWTTNPTDMDYQGGDEQNCRRIYKALGTNPVVTGELQGANRAQSYVADDIMCDYVLNPTGAMLGEVMTKTLASRPQFLMPGVKLYIWVDECRPHDAELKLSQLSFLAANNWITGNEARTSFDLKSADGLDKLPTPAPTVEPPSALPQSAGRRAAQQAERQNPVA